MSPFYNPTPAPPSLIYLIYEQYTLVTPTLEIGWSLGRQPSLRFSSLKFLVEKQTFPGCSN